MLKSFFWWDEKLRYKSLRASRRRRTTTTMNTKFPWISHCFSWTSLSSNFSATTTKRERIYFPSNMSGASTSWNKLNYRRSGNNYSVVIEQLQSRVMETVNKVSKKSQLLLRWHLRLNQHCNEVFLFIPARRWHIPWPNWIFKSFKSLLFFLTLQKASSTNKTKLFPSEQNFLLCTGRSKECPKHLCFFVVLKVPHRRSPARDEGLETSHQEMPLFQPFRLPMFSFRTSESAKIYPGLSFSQRKKSLHSCTVR